MPRRNSLEIIECPHQYKGKCLRMNKSYTSQNFKSDTILTDDIFTYIEFFFASHNTTIYFIGNKLQVSTKLPKSFQ